MNPIIYILISLLLTITEGKKLRLALNLYKHGATSPKNLSEDKNDIFGETWDDNEDELTSVGLRQEYLIGYLNYLRYIQEFEYLKQKYDPRETLFYTLNYNKSIVSSYAQSQGFYFPSTGPNLTPKQIENGVPPIDKKYYEKEKENLRNEALPSRISISPSVIIYENDLLIKSLDNNLCEGRKKNLNNWSDNMKKQKNKINETFSKVIGQILKEKTENVFNNNSKTKIIFDTILSEYYNGNDMSQFKTEKYDSDIVKDILLFYQYDYENEKDENVIIKTVGPFIRWIISLCDLRIKKDKEGKEKELDYKLPKFIGFSSDDSIIKPFEYIMKLVFNTTIEYAEFGSYLNLELFKINNKNASKLTDEDYHFEYNFNGHFKLSIPYAEFKKKLNDKIKSDNEVKKFCNFIDGKPFYKDLFFIFSIILTIVFVILVVILVKVNKKKEVETETFLPLANKEI